jgi:hypothetical protein
MVLYHKPPPRAAEAQREAAKASAWWNTKTTMQEGIVFNYLNCCRRSRL